MCGSGARSKMCSIRVYGRHGRWRVIETAASCAQRIALPGSGLMRCCQEGAELERAEDLRSARADRLLEGWRASSGVQVVL